MGKSCSTILDGVLSNLRQSTNDELNWVLGRALKECARSEPNKAVTVVEHLIEDGIPRQGVERGLEAVGDAAISDVNALLKNKLRNGLRPSGEYVPHLYRNRESSLTAQFPEWFFSDEWFFRDAVNSVVSYSINPPPGAVDPNSPFNVDIDEIYQELCSLVQAVNLNPDDVNGFSNDKELRSHLLTEDLCHISNYDWIKMENRLQQYPALERFLTNTNWKNTLKSHNRHPIGESLNSDYQINDDILTHLDYCLSYVNPDNDRVADLQNHLLTRHQYPHTVPELQLIALLRRQFGKSSTEIESPIPNTNKDTDAKVTTQGHNIRIEVTRPDPDDILRVGGIATRSYGRETNPARGKVTQKARTQLDAVKANTSDLTVLGISKRLFGVSEEETADYVLGQRVLKIQNGKMIKTREQSTIPLDSSTGNIDYILTFGPNNTDRNISNPDARLFVIRSPPNVVTSGLKQAFDAKVEKY
jgi:hypothetical protein